MASRGPGSKRGARRSSGSGGSSGKRSSKSKAKPSSGGSKVAMVGAGEEIGAVNGDIEVCL